MKKSNKMSLSVEAIPEMKSTTLPRGEGLSTGEPMSDCESVSEELYVAAKKKCFVTFFNFLKPSF